MPPNSLHAHTRTHLPFSVIPVLPITDQIRIVQLVFSNLKKQGASAQKDFLEKLSKLEDDYFIKVFNTFKPIGRNLWKFNKFCFMYAP
ncbi:MAG: hypothetical protein ACFFFH_10990, partial [Candidatus Thorarchaeota archaeon]